MFDKNWKGLKVFKVFLLYRYWTINDTFGSGTRASTKTFFDWTSDSLEWIYSHTHSTDSGLKSTSPLRINAYAWKIRHIWSLTIIFASLLPAFESRAYPHSIFFKLLKENLLGLQIFTSQWAGMNQTLLLKLIWSFTKNE